MIRRKHISKIIAILLAACFLAGCNGTSGDKPTSEGIADEKISEADLTEEIIAEEDKSSVDNISASESEGEKEVSVDSIELPEVEEEYQLDISEVPAYSGMPYTAVDDNKPGFADSDMTTEPFEKYSELDNLGRCGAAFANICQETMPNEERGEIGMIKPSGWHTANYHELVDGNYLYNRCHLIAFSLAGENANEKNLITGTRYMNVEGMLPFENEVYDYVESTNHHVLYRVTPIFEGDNLLASGVEMEAMSVEDDGDGISFHVYCYNVQPNIIIDYATGDSAVDENALAKESLQPGDAGQPVE